MLFAACFVLRDVIAAGTQCRMIRSGRPALLLLRKAIRVVFFMSLLANPTSLAIAARGEYFGIHVVDDQTGRGVPLVELQTTSKIRFVTDSNGYVAFLEPGLMDQDVYFEISSWGYQASAIGFGFKGTVLHTTAGNEVDVKIHRLNIAQRLYRLTGEGIYRDTVLLGKQPPIVQGLLNGKVMGSDTVETAIYRNKMYWFWGDTDCPQFPLGNFATSGATSQLPNQLNLDRGIDYTYFINPKSGFARGMISVPSKDSLPIWVDGLMVVPDQSKRERMLCHFVRTRDLKVVEQGLAEFNDDKELFEAIQTDPVNSALEPGGRPLRAVSDGKLYYYFPRPFPIKRVLADYEHAKDASAYEGFSCQKPGTDSSTNQPQVNRDLTGHLLWSWQKGAQPIGPDQFAALVKSGLVRGDESPYDITDSQTKKHIRAVEVTVAWNPYLKKWTMLCGQAGGDSNLGEIWLAVGNAPEGPWSPAYKVATHAMKHDNNDFYNPMQHPEFMQENGRIIYFEGTFVTTFSGNPVPTPRYDYNQILYRIDLSDSRLAFAEPPPGLTNTQPAN